MRCGRAGKGKRARLYRSLRTLLSFRCCSTRPACLPLQTHRTAHRISGAAATMSPSHVLSS